MGILYLNGDSRYSMRERFGMWPRMGVLFCGVLLGWGCSGDSPQGALVEIGEVEIGEADLRHFQANLPTALKPAGTGEEAVRDLLQSLVDRQLMILEATAKGYDRDLVVLDRLQRVLNDRLKKQVFQDEIARRVRVTTPTGRASNQGSRSPGWTSAGARLKRHAAWSWRR